MTQNLLNSSIFFFMLNLIVMKDGYLEMLQTLNDDFKMFFYSILEQISLNILPLQNVSHFLKDNIPY